MGKMRSPHPDRKHFSLSDAGKERLGNFEQWQGARSRKSRTYQEGGGRMVESYTENVDEVIHLKERGSNEKWSLILG